MGSGDHDWVAGPCQAVFPSSCSAPIASPIHPHSHWATSLPLCFPWLPSCEKEPGTPGPSQGPIEDSTATYSKSSNHPLRVKQSRAGETGGGSGSRAWGIPVSPPALLLASLLGQPWGNGTPTPQSHPELLQPWLLPEDAQEAMAQRHLTKNTSAHPRSSIQVAKWLS